MAIGIRVFPTNGAESLLAARGVQLAVDTPEQSLARVRNYYLKTIGSEDLERVGKVAQEQGPVILGSNSCGNCSFVAGHPEEVLVSIKIDDGLLHIAGRFRDEDGQLLIELSPGKRPTFSRPGARLQQVGSGPILLAEKAMGTAVIATENRTFLAVRMSHTGRAVVSSMELRSKDGRLVGAVQQESLVLRGASMRFSDAL